MANTVKLPPIAPGQQYGRLTSVCFSGVDRGGKAVWQFQCSCGRTMTARAASVRHRREASCGCLQREAATKHGMHNSPEYKSWEQMLDRCRNKKHHAYKDYGGRGIRVCEQWLKFENFYSDMGPRPEGYSIDRYPDNDGNYEPGNCRWASPIDQGGNRRPPAVYRALSKKNASGTTGVKAHSSGKWQATITVSGVRHHLGTFASKEDAAAVVNEARANFAKSSAILRPE